jgi:hypothetical protein
MMKSCFLMGRQIGDGQRDFMADGRASRSVENL